MVRGDDAEENHDVDDADDNHLFRHPVPSVGGGVQLSKDGAGHRAVWGRIDERDQIPSLY